MPDATVRKGRVPSEVAAVGGVVFALLFVGLAGLGLSAVLPERTPWLIAAAYLAPASLAFAAYWWIAQRS